MSDLSRTLTEAAEQRTTIALVPSGQSLDMVSAVGGLLDVALGGAMLAAGNGGDVAARIELRDTQSERDAVARLRAAKRRLTRDRPDMRPEDDPGEEDQPTLQSLRHEDGGLTFGIAGEQARDMAHALLAAFIPAIRAWEAPNYLTFDATDRETGDRYALIVVKPDGKTPHELRGEAEAEVARLRELLAEHGVSDVLGVQEEVSDGGS